jgi:peptidoglycan/LPS O-acetylase OafA/YrhL
LQRGIVVAADYLFVVALAYALMRWYDRPVRAWLSRRWLGAPGAPERTASPASPAGLVAEPAVLRSASADR